MPASRTVRPALRRATPALAATVLATALLAGCSGGSHDASSSSVGSSGSSGAGAAVGAPQPAVGAPEKAVGAAQPAAGTADAGAANSSSTSATALVVTGAALIRTADLSLDVRDVRAAADAAAGLVRGAGGSVESEQDGVPTPGPLPYDSAPSTGTAQKAPDGGTGARLVLRVPQDRFDDALAGLARLGDQRGRTVSTQEVGDQLVDLQARVAAQQASVDRVQQLYSSAKDLTQVVQLEGELTRRLADLDSLKARVAGLSGQVEMSTITLSLTRTAPPAAKAAATGGFGSGLDAGVSALTGFLRGLATVAGAVLPFAWVLVLAAVALWWLRRRAGRSTGPAPESAPAA